MSRNSSFPSRSSLVKEPCRPTSRSLAASCSLSPFTLPCQLLFSSRENFFRSRFNPSSRPAARKPLMHPLHPPCQPFFSSFFGSMHPLTCFYQLFQSIYQKNNPQKHSPGLNKKTRFHACKTFNTTQRRKTSAPLNLPPLLSFMPPQPMESA